MSLKASVGILGTDGRSFSFFMSEGLPVMDDYLLKKWRNKVFLLLFIALDFSVVLCLEELLSDRVQEVQQSP